MRCCFAAGSSLVASLLLATAGGCHSTGEFAPETAGADGPGTPEDAWTACRGFAERRLRDPESAEWPSYPSSDVHVQSIAEQPNRFGVISSVRASNSRGQPTRQTVVCMVDWKPEQRQWEAVTVTSKYGGLYDRDIPLSLP